MSGRCGTACCSTIVFQTSKAVLGGAIESLVGCAADWKAGQHPDNPGSATDLGLGRDANRAFGLMPVTRLLFRSALRQAHRARVIVA
jgi:hypothetical protein